MYEYFKRPTGEFVQESLLTAVQNNDKKTNYIKTKTDITKPSYKCGLREDRDEMINLIISKGNKLTQKE